MAFTKNHAFSSADAPVARDRAIDTTAIECPSCHAPVGQVCASAAGLKTAHRARRRMAIRALLQTAEPYSVDDVRYAQRVTTSARRSLRLRAGLSCRELGDLLGTAGQNVQRWEQRGSQPSGSAGARYGAWLREQMEPNSG